MKAVFPTKGVVIVTKYNVKVLKEYYKNTLINSKLFSIYQQSNLSMQAGNLNYLPKKSNIILYKANLLTLQQLQEVVAKQIQESQEYEENQKSVESKNQNTISNEPLDDNFIKSNPFFKTLMSMED